jgi:hypothetical protein
LELVGRDGGGAVIPRGEDITAMSESVKNCERSEM